MSKEVPLPNPKTADYQLKDVQISFLSGKEQEFSNFAIYDIGETLTQHPQLSNKQREELLLKLKEGRLLTYQIDYNNELDEAEKRNQKVTSVTDSFNPVLWDVERDGRLQALALSVSAQLTTFRPFTEEISIIASLLDVAHNTASSWYEDYVDYTNSIDALDNQESEMFARHNNYISELKYRRLMTQAEVDDIGDKVPNKTLAETEESYSMPKEMLLTTAYDKLMALHLLKQIDRTSTEKIFRKLQDVLHTGFARGIRTEIEADERITLEWRFAKG